MYKKILQKIIQTPLVQKIMQNPVVQRIKKFLSIMISIVFWLVIILEIMSFLASACELRSFAGTNLEDIMLYKLKTSEIWLIVCLASIWSNKKLLMLVWIIAWWHIDGIVMIFPEYNHYREKEDCLDLSQGVWDYDEQRCRTDCWKWDKEHGCYEINENSDILYQEEIKKITGQRTQNSDTVK